MQHKTGLISAGVIVGLVSFGSIAVAANLGVLGNSKDQSFGQISAANTSVSAGSAVPVSLVAQEVGATATTDGTVSHFDVAAAGSLNVVARGEMVAVHSVTPAAGWTWTAFQRDPRSVMVEFNSATSQVRFTGTRAEDGTVTGRVETHAHSQSPLPSTNTAAPHSEHEHEHEQEHEGGGDDD